VGSLQEEVEIRDLVGHDQHHKDPGQDERQDEAKEGQPRQLVDIEVDRVARPVLRFVGLAFRYLSYHGS